MTSSFIMSMGCLNRVVGGKQCQILCLMGVGDAIVGHQESVGFQINRMTVMVGKGLGFGSV